MDARWRRETAFHLSVISAALNARARWDHSNASLWRRRCTVLLTTAAFTLQQGRKPPPEWWPQFDRLMINLDQNSTTTSTEVR